MGTPIRVGIIGVGWGSVVQTPAFRAVPEFDVAALCSRRAERVAQAGEKLGIGDVSTDWREFVRRDDLDLISVCTPVEVHAEQAIAAFEAGKHVLCEKPVAVNSGDARRMLDAAEAAGTANAVCFENRYDPIRLAIWDRVRAGYLGTPYFARAHTTGDYWHPTRGLQSEWMYRLDAGGGYLMGLLSHDIDFIRCLFGEVDAVCADVRCTVPRRERPDGSMLDVDADDTSALLLRMRAGFLAMVSCSTVGLGRDRRELELLGSDGSIHLDGDVQAQQAEARGSHLGDAEPTEIPPDSRLPRSGVELPQRRARSAILALALMLEDWLPAFAGEDAPGVPSLRDGWRTQCVIDAARRSAAGAGWVTLEGA